MTQGQRSCEQLLADPQTSRHVSDLLRGAGFVDRSVAFRDLTGDKPEALVRVQSGGAAGTVAIYVFSTTRPPRQRPAGRVPQPEALPRLTTVNDEGVLTYATARYAPGDGSLPRQAARDQPALRRPS